jgi:hypothetical protein
MVDIVRTRNIRQSETLGLLVTHLANEVDYAMKFTNNFAEKKTI